MNGLLFFLCVLIPATVIGLFRFPKSSLRPFWPPLRDSLMYNAHQLDSSCEFLIMPDHFQYIKLQAQLMLSDPIFLSPALSSTLWLCSNCHFLRKDELLQGWMSAALCGCLFADSGAAQRGGRDVSSRRV